MSAIKYSGSGFSAAAFIALARSARRVTRGPPGTGNDSRSLVPPGGKRERLAPCVAEVVVSLSERPHGSGGVIVEQLRSRQSDADSSTTELYLGGDERRTRLSEREVSW